LLRHIVYVVSAASGSFLVEWYRGELADESLRRAAADLEDSAESMCEQGSPVHLVSVLVVPTDEVVYALFSAASAAVVAQTCDRAGLPAQRLSAAAEIPIPRGGR
jgi:hypothetical protein